jgi:hypothetical protein
MFGLKLVDDWKRCHRWLSIRFLAIGGAVQGIVVAVGATPMSQYVQPWVLTALSDFALVCMLAAAIGRVIDQKENTDELDQPVQH